MVDEDVLVELLVVARAEGDAPRRARVGDGLDPGDHIRAGGERRDGRAVLEETVRATGVGALDACCEDGRENE